MRDGPVAGGRRRWRERWALALVLLALPAAPLRAHPGDACELDSECDSGEQCRRQMCGPRSLAPIVPDTPRASGRRPSGSAVCMTSTLTCPLPGVEMSGTLCFCDTLAGPVGGIVP